MSVSGERDDRIACRELGQAETLQTERGWKTRRHIASQIVSGPSGWPYEDSLRIRGTREKKIAGRRQSVGSEGGNTDSKRHTCLPRPPPGIRNSSVTLPYGRNCITRR
jgi:hypothetical protein